MHLNHRIIIKAHFTEHQADIEQEVEAVKEAFDKTPLLLVDLDFLVLFRDSLVLISNGVLQEDDLLADFGFRLSPFPKDVVAV